MAVQSYNARYLTIHINYQYKCLNPNDQCKCQEFLYSMKSATPAKKAHVRLCDNELRSHRYHAIILTGANVVLSRAFIVIIK